MSLREVVATRVVRRERSGSSSPVVVETLHDGLWFTKLRGAAQGIRPLIAELIVAQLAESLQLAVPARALVTLPADVPSDDMNDELRDLLDASAGVNMAYAMLEAARNLTPPEFDRVPLDVAVGVLWLDILVQNLDRSPANPNIMVRRGTYWLVDHGAALPVHHDWRAVTEQSAQRAYDIGGHLFSWAAPVLPDIHATLAQRMTRAAIQAATDAVPSEFLDDLIDPLRQRAMYAAWLWKRLQWMESQYG